MGPPYIIVAVHVSMSLRIRIQSCPLLAGTTLIMPVLESLCSRELNGLFDLDRVRVPELALNQVVEIGVLLLALL